MRAGLLLIGVLFCWGLFVLGLTVMDKIRSNQTIHDINGDTPQDAVERFMEASFTNDIDAIYAITCPQIHQEMVSFVSERGVSPTSIDFSDTSFDLKHHDYENDRAYVVIRGIATVENNGVSGAIDLDEIAAEEGADFYGEFAAKINDVWIVCEDYPVPLVVQN